MMKFLLVVAGEVVDCADSPDRLLFSKTVDHTSYEVRIDIDGTVYPLAAVDLAGYEHLRHDEDQADWVKQELCKDITFRMAFPGFEDELKIVDGPLIAFGEPHIGPDGFIGRNDGNDCNDGNDGNDCNSREGSPRG